MEESGRTSAKFFFVTGSGVSFMAPSCFLDWLCLLAVRSCLAAFVVTKTGILKDNQSDAHIMPCGAPRKHAVTYIFQLEKVLAF